MSFQRQTSDAPSVMSISSDGSAAAAPVRLTRADLVVLRSLIDNARAAAAVPVPITPENIRAGAHYYLPVTPPELREADGGVGYQTPMPDDGCQTPFVPTAAGCMLPVTPAVGEFVPTTPQHPLHARMEALEGAVLMLCQQISDLQSTMAKQKADS
mmetsp:Transcript_24284/g.56392  ORF Transcript_24284/g.56392 Transcript_24284/m.56392 type:complete len:156 (-) Transcript_24284:75-542(-)